MDMEFTLKQILGESLKIEDKIDRLDCFISENGDRVKGLMGTEDINEYAKTVHKIAMDLRKALEKRLEFERKRKIDFHDPQIQKALSLILNIVMDTLFEAGVEQVKLGSFKKSLMEKLVGIEERLNRLSLSDEVVIWKAEEK